MFGNLCTQNRITEGPVVRYRIKRHRSSGSEYQRNEPSGENIIQCEIDDVFARLIKIYKNMDQRREV